MGATLQEPLRFIPFVRPMVWGGRRLGTHLGKQLPTEQPYGESWEISDHPLHRSVVAEGPGVGHSLRELMETNPEGLLGRAAGKFTTFPWLVKFLDAHDWLSVQVHPDEEAVRRLWPGEGSKTEAWFVIDALPGSRVYAGLKPGVDEKQLHAGLAKGGITECLHSFTPRPGDCVFLPAGTVHAVGGGVLIAEVQQTSDATFRLFDWNRRDTQGKQRALHVEESMACIHWEQGPVDPIHAAGYDDAEGCSGRSPNRQTLVHCPYFTVEYLQESQPFERGGQERLQVLLVLQGTGRLSGQEQTRELSRGQTWVLPAVMPSCQFKPASPFKALLCTLPASLGN